MIWFDWPLVSQSVINFVLIREIPSFVRLSQFWQVFFFWYFGSRFFKCPKFFFLQFYHHHHHRNETRRKNIQDVVVVDVNLEHKHHKYLWLVDGQKILLFVCLFHPFDWFDWLICESKFQYNLYEYFFVVEWIEMFVWGEKNEREKKINIGGWFLFENFLSSYIQSQTTIQSINQSMAIERERERGFF